MAAGLMWVSVATYDGAVYGWSGNPFAAEGDPAFDDPMNEFNALPFVLEFATKAHQGGAQASALSPDTGRTEPAPPLSTAIAGTSASAAAAAQSKKKSKKKKKKKKNKALKAFFVTGGTDETIRIFDLVKRRDVGTLLEHEGTVTCVDFAGSTHMLSAGEDGKICIWRIHDWTCIHKLAGHTAPVRALAVHASGRFALSCGDDSMLRMWNLIKGRAAAAFKLDGKARCLQWSPDVSRYGVGVDKTVVVYSVATGEKERVLELPHPVNCIAFLSDDLVAVGVEDATLRLFSIASGVCVVELPTEHQSRIKSIACGSCADGSLPILVTASSEGKVLVWSAADVVDAELASKAVPLATLSTHGRRITTLSVSNPAWKSPTSATSIAAAVAAADSSEDGAGAGAGAGSNAKKQKAKKKTKKKTKKKGKAGNEASEVADVEDDRSVATKRKKKPQGNNKPGARQRKRQRKR